MALIPPATWLQCTAPRPDAQRRLVCFPHEGGVASFFGRWAEGLPGTEVHAVRYPGRAERGREPCATDVHLLAGDIARAVRPLADRPLALFGHSLGAWIAFETARSLTRAGVAVSHLFASGARAPQTRTAPESGRGADSGSGPGLAGCGDGEFAAVLEAGVAELLAEPVLLKLVFPYVEADARMADGYIHRPGPPLDCPVTTLVGADDPVVTAEDAAAWAHQTRGGHSGHTLPGRHHYLAAHPPLVLVHQLLDTAATDPGRPGPPLHHR